MPEYYFYIAGLISKYLSTTISQEELDELNQWREKSPGNEKLFQKICDRENISHHESEKAKFNKQKGWNELNKRIQLSIRRKYIIRIISYAAIIILPIFMALLLITNQKETIRIAQQITEPIQPGDKKAVLTLDNGEVINLENFKNKEINEKDGTSINIDEAALNYQSDTSKKEAAKEIYNRIDIPRGGEYSLLLSDGTKIYLNAMSSLRFPVRFTGDVRQVELTGEAYFEVAKKEQPFIVKVNNMEVEVLGTRFNISAYPEEDYQTTLVSGSVKVYAQDRQASYKLNPSEQAVFNSQTDKIDIREVDVSLYTSWIEGKIYFKDQRLEDIMKSLSRWYDMEVVYENEKVKNLRFGCNVDRYEDISPFLELLEKTGKVKITKEGKKITIK